MSVNTLEAFAPDAASGVSVGASSVAYLLPGSSLGSDTVLRIVNMGAMPVFCKLGTTNAVTVTNATGVCVMGGSTLVLTLGSNTYVAMTTGTPGTSSSVNLATGN
jgi:hypothetical protein